MLESLTTWKPVFAAAALAALWTLEGAAPLFERRSTRGRHYAANLALGVLNALVGAALFAGAVLAVTEWARVAGFGLLHWLALPPWASVVTAIVLFDLWQYLWHRLNHRVRFLWRFHAVHHADAEMDASTATRFHTGEILLSFTARLAVLPLLGMTVVQLALYETLLLPVILFHHSNVRIPGAWDRRLRWLIVTPWMHWVHHSNYQPETDSNYASIFSFWDRLFGTFRLRAQPRDLTLGLAQWGPSETRNLGAMLTMPFRLPNDGASARPGARGDST